MWITPQKNLKAIKFSLVYVTIGMTGESASKGNLLAQINVVAKGNSTTAHQGYLLQNCKFSKSFILNLNLFIWFARWLIMCCMELLTSLYEKCSCCLSYRWFLADMGYVFTWIPNPSSFPPTSFADFPNLLLLVCIIVTTTQFKTIKSQFS